MARPVDQQICFRLADAVPAVSLPQPLRLGDAQAEALSELLQVFACGEESASVAFARLGDSSFEEAARCALARVAEEELIHERLLRGLRNALPAPAPVAFAADRRSVTIGAGAGRGSVLLVRFAQKRTTRIAGGEHAHPTLQDANGVEALTSLGSWDGSLLRFPIEPPAAGKGIAVLVQAADGRMLGAAALPLKNRHP